MERLHKFLSRAGIASRRTAEQMIVDGKVKVNGKVVTTLGSRVDPNKDLVVVAGQPATISSQRKYFLFYKPPGVVTTLSDPQGRATIADFTKFIGSRIFPVGRLDFDAEGALLLTDDGDLANKLMHPSHEVPRVYLAKVKGEPDRGSLDKLLEGVRLEDGMARATEASVFEKAEKNTWIKLVVTEGRQHLVKRLCAAIGHPVVRLFRPSHAGLPVHGMKPGELRELSFEEIKRVKVLTEGGDFPQPPLALPARRHGHGVPGLAHSEDTSYEARSERSEGPERTERPQRGARPERAEGAARPQRGARPERAERAASPERAPRPDRDDLPELPDRGEAAAPEARKPGGKVYSGDRNPTFKGEQKTFDRAPFRADGKTFDRKPERPETGALGERKPAFARREPGAFGKAKAKFSGEGGGEGRSFGEHKPSFARREPGAFGKPKPKFSGEGGGEGRKSFGDRKPSFRKEGKPFGDRKPAYRSEEGGEGKKPFGDRKPPFGRKSFGDRKPFFKAGEGGKKPFGDRKPSFRSEEGGEGKKSFGDRKPLFKGGEGGKKSFGDRKGPPRGEGGPAGRKSFGKKPFGGGGRFGAAKAPGGKGRAGSLSGGARRDSGRGKPRGSW